MHNPPIILIADDEVGFQEIIGSTLKKYGYLVAEAHNGAEAVEKAETLNPDLVLMDINMPNENGTEAALDILQNPATRGTRVVFLSTMKDPWPGVETDLAKVAHELGAIEFIDKSSDLDKIGERVKGFLDEAAKQPAA